MKIYTKTGDDGSTSLIGGKRVSKDNNRIEAYGTVDELISFTGLLRDQDIDKLTKEILIHIQENLMKCAAILAWDGENYNAKVPEIRNDDILFLEKEIDSMEMNLEPLKVFVIPGGHIVVSLCHVARTVCRRAERHIIRLEKESKVDEPVIKYMNGLSDFFFVLSRKFVKEFKLNEIQWHPNF
jgi:cob(I)alamin adenosyltransferase